jgi:hypothetical protein
MMVLEVVVKGLVQMLCAIFTCRADSWLARRGFGDSEHVIGQDGESHEF